MRKHDSEMFKADAVKALMKEEKTISQLAAQLDVHPSQLKEWKRIALQGLPDLFSREGKAGEQVKAHEQQVNELSNEIGRLTTQVNCALRAPEKNLALTLRRSERLALVERAANAPKGHPPLSLQAERLSLNRSSLY